MITNKEAAKYAMEYIKDLLPDVEYMLLEEVEMDESSNYWIITISFDSPVPARSIAIAFNKTRLYKTIKVNAGDGSIVSMKIRNFSSNE